MSMEIVYLGNGITNHVYEVRDHIKENKNEFLCVGRIHDGAKNYSFAAIFKNKCIVGKKTVIMEEWGSNDGISGVGGAGYKSMNKFLEENAIPVIDLTLTPEDAKKIGYMNAADPDMYLEEWEDRKKIWESYLETIAKRC